VNIDLASAPNHKNHGVSDKYKYGFIYHFVPHPETNSKATLLSNKFLLIYCGLLLALFSFFRLLPRAIPGVLGYASEIKVSELFQLTNTLRTDRNLNALTINEELSRAAHKKAEDMFKKGYWAHVAPDGTQPWDFILAEDYDYSYAGENLAKNFGSSKQVVEAWYESPSHRDNLLGKNYTDVGYAVVNGVLEGYETTLVVQMFGKPRNGGASDITSSAASTNQEKILERLDAEQPKELEVVPVVPAVKENVVNVVHFPTEKEETAQILSALDINSATKSINIVLALFVICLLAVDIWYSRRKGITKFTGHTLAHIALLIIVTLGIWFVMTPGKIL
jgi:hypothetical protein